MDSVGIHVTDLGLVAGGTSAWWFWDSLDRLGHGALLVIAIAIGGLRIVQMVLRIVQMVRDLRREERRPAEEKPRR